MTNTEINELFEKVKPEFHHGRYAKACSFLNQLINKNSKNTSAYLLLSMSHLLLARDKQNKSKKNKQNKKNKQTYNENMQDAIKNADKVIELDSENILGNLVRANCYVSLKDYQNALKLCDKVINLSNNKLGYMGKGFCFYSLKKYDKAIKNYNKVIPLDNDSFNDLMSDLSLDNVGGISNTDLDKNNLSNYLCRGISYLETDHFDNAIEDFNQVIELNNKNIHGYLNRGNCYLYSNKYDNAIEDFNQVIKLDKKNVNGYLNRAICYIYLKKYDNAIEDFNQVTQLDNKNINGYLNRANCHMFLNKLDDAIKDFTKIIEIDNKNILAYLRRGNCYRSLKKYEKAIIDFNKIVEIDSKHVLSRLYRGECYYTLLEYKQATQDFEIARRLSYVFIDFTCNEYTNQNIEYYCSSIRMKYESMKQIIFKSISKENISEKILQEFKQLHMMMIQDFFFIERDLSPQKYDFFNHITMVKHEIFNEISNYIDDIKAIKNMEHKENIQFINTLQDLINIKAENFNNNRVFRGMNRTSWALTPNIFREEIQQNKNDLLQNFKREASALSTIDFSHYTTVDWVSLMQHHGCPTPLLDWTQSFSIALFFSKYAKTPNADPKGIPIIYSYTCDEIKLDTDVNHHIENDFKNKDNLKHDIIFFAPNNHHNRAYIQKSMFSYHMDNTPVDKIVNHENMIKYIINPILLDDINNILQIDQINISSIYPDLEHLSLRLKHTNSMSNINFEKQQFNINMPKMSDIITSMEDVIDSPIFCSTFKSVN